jgi:DNA-binding transcriptional LysR family regulator
MMAFSITKSYSAFSLGKVLRAVLNLRQLEIFRELMRCQTTIGAAEALGLSQPAISNAIKHMETKLGFPLFDRTGNRLMATAEAQEILRDSDPIFLMYRSFSQKLRGLKDGRLGNLRLLATPPIANALVPTALRAFLSTRPDLHVFFDVRRADGIIEGLETGFADLGISLEPNARPGLTAELIGTGEMVCVFPDDHPLAAKSEVSAAQLRQYPYIGFEHGSRLGSLLQREFFGHTGPQHSIVEVRYSNTACLLAESGVGVAIVDSFTGITGNRYRLSFRPLRPRVSVAAYALYQKERGPKRLVRAFIEELRRVANRPLQDGELGI